MTWSPANAHIMTTKIKKTSTAKRLSAYSTLAAATAMGAGSANAAMVTHDIADISVSGGFAGTLWLDIVSGATTGVDKSSSSFGAQGVFGLRVGLSGDRGVILGPNTGYSSAVGGFVGTGSNNVTRLTGGVVSAGQTFVAVAGSYSQYAGVGAGTNTWGFQDGERGYVGIEFEIGSSMHYGFAEITRELADDSYTLHSFGYNDAAGESAVLASVPEPSSLAMLALGATGLMRRRRQKAA